MTGLRGSTLTYIVRELLDRDVVRTSGKGISQGAGKKHILLQINPALGWTLGVSLRPAQASLLMLDAAGGTIASQTVPIGPTLQEFPAQLQKSLSYWLKQISPPAGKMLGLGVSVPGVVDTDRGIVLKSIIFDATDYPLRQRLIEQFHVPTVIDHDACSGAISEAIAGVARGTSHFVYFLINHSQTGRTVHFNSYGSALYLEGKIYRGAHYSAGELADLAPGAIDVDLKDLQALREPDAPVPEAAAPIVAGVAKTVAAIINLIDLQTVVIGGTAGICNNAFLTAVERQITSAVIDVPGRLVRVVHTTVGADAVAQGAAIAAADAALFDGTGSPQVPAKELR
jgi:predicted NBD/HSP70 family sugar kinase